VDGLQPTVCHLDKIERHLGPWLQCRWIDPAVAPVKEHIARRLSTEDKSVSPGRIVLLDATGEPPGDGADHRMHALTWRLPRSTGIRTASGRPVRRNAAGPDAQVFGNGHHNSFKAVQPRQEIIPVRPVLRPAAGRRPRRLPPFSFLCLPTLIPFLRHHSLASIEGVAVHDR
jgi:hypothetical protein